MKAIINFSDYIKKETLAIEITEETVSQKNKEVVNIGDGEVEFSLVTDHKT